MEPTKSPGVYQRRDRLSTIPGELLLKIFQLFCPAYTDQKTYLRDIDYETLEGQSNLASLSLVCKKFYDYSKPLLLYSVTMQTPACLESTSRCLELIVKSLAINPAQGLHIRKLALTNDEETLRLVHNSLSCIIMPNATFRAHLNSSHHPQALSQLMEWYESQLGYNFEDEEPATFLPPPGSTVLLMAPNVETLVLDVDARQPYWLEGELELKSLKCLYLTGHAAAQDFSDMEHLFQSVPNLETLFVLSSLPATWFRLQPMSNLRKVMMTGIQCRDMKRLVDGCPLLDDIEYYPPSAFHRGSIDAQELVDAFSSGKDRIKRLHITHLPMSRLNWLTDVDGDMDWPDQFTEEFIRTMELNHMHTNEAMRKFREFTRLEDFGIDMVSLFGLEDMLHAQWLDVNDVAAILPPTIRAVRFYYSNLAMIDTVVQLAKLAATCFPRLEWMALGLMGPPEMQPSTVDWAGAILKAEAELLGNKDKYIPVCWNFDNFDTLPRYRFPDNTSAARALSFPRSEGFWEEFRTMGDMELYRSRRSEKRSMPWLGFDGKGDLLDEDTFSMVQEKLSPSHGDSNEGYSEGVESGGYDSANITELQEN